MRKPFSFRASNIFSASFAEREATFLTSYTSTWFQSFRVSSGKSAQCIVPLLTELAQPTSVVDFGCGLGVWLAEFARRGVTDVMGVDGRYVKQHELLIDSSQFEPHDLTRPPQLQRHFDLCLCLEVAEHLPESSADPLVQSLTQAAPIIYFSAAIPTQGGTGHVNEQWPEYLGGQVCVARLSGH